MATGNFYNHENGIFTIRRREFEETLENMEENLDEGETVSDDMVYAEINFIEELDARDFFEFTLKDYLEENGIDLQVENQFHAKAYRNGKLMAGLVLESGYYEGAQVIVETNPEELFDGDMDIYYDARANDYRDEIVQSSLNEVYTPHNKTLFKILGKVTDAYEVYAQFSNGETMYNKVG